METKLNSLRELIEKILVRVDKAKEDNKISRIEQDIMLDLLRQAYLAIEDLNEKTSIKAEFHKAPVVQVIQPAHAEVPDEKHIASPEVVEEKIAEPVTSSVYSAPSVMQPAEPEKPATEPEQVYIAPGVKQPEFEVPKPSPVDIDQVPVMSFPKVEVEEAHEKPIEPQPTVIPAPRIEIPAPLTETQALRTETPAPRVETPAPRVETPSPSKPPKPETDLFGGQTLADKLKSETPSLNEKITQGRGDHSLGQRMQAKPISDLRTAIGINEKFQFVNDLFEGRIEMYNDAITNLNNCNSGLVAENILYDLKLKHNWNDKTEAYGKLKNFVTRRYM